MKSKGLALLSILVVSGFLGLAHAQIPKEGTQSSLIGYSTTYKIVAMGQERFQMAYEVLGVIVSDATDCILQNASLRCVGSFHAIKGVYEDERFLCLHSPGWGPNLYIL